MCELSQNQRKTLALLSEGECLCTTPKKKITPGGIGHYMNLEKINFCACIWGRDIHVCDSKYKNGQSLLYLRAEGVQQGMRVG